MKLSVALPLTFVLIPTLFVPATTNAQVIADPTLGTNVQTSGSVFNIFGGTISNSNQSLFHSFSDFAIASGQSVIFQNDPTIAQIFARITGSNPSTINGFLQTQGNSDLFFINPNGIHFGTTASLDLGGSFIASTANSIQFDNGFLFSTAPVDNSSLLTVQLPQKLLFSNPGNISNQTYTSRLLTATNANPAGQRGLYVEKDKTLALLGGNINFSRGIVEAPDGKIELAALTDGSTVNISQGANGWNFDYSSVASFNDITLDDQSWLISFSSVVFGSNFRSSSVNPNNSVNGEISLWGDDITLANSSNIPLFTYSDTENGGDLLINATNLNLNNGSSIYALAFGSGNAGDIQINVKDRFEMVGNNLNQAQVLRNFRIPTSIYDRTSGNGDSGTISIATKSLSLSAGAQISASTFSAGNGGSVNISAEDISISGFNLFASAIFAQTTAGASGQGGSVDITTNTLNILNGGTISVDSLNNFGNAGTLNINAAESILISGGAFNRRNVFVPSALFSSGTAGGDSGNIFIAVPNLTVSDFGEITVSNSGTGSAGNLQILSERLIVKNNGQISAESNAGSQGNITLKPLGDKSVVILDNGAITTNAKGSANGGNINLTTDVLVMLNGSRIVAQAEAGDGGNINITAQGYLISRDSLISASSAFGLDGVVELDSPDGAGVQGVVDLQSAPVDPDSLVATNACAAGEGNEFVATGRGGIPASPTDFMTTAIWLPRFGGDRQTEYASAQGWARDDAGQTVLLGDLGAAGQKAFEARNWQQAQESWLQAVEVFQARGDRRNTLRMISYLALAYGEMGDWDKANRLVEIGLQESQGLQTTADDPIVADVMHNGAILLAKQGQYDRAIQLWVDAATLYDLQGDRLSVLRSVYHQAYALNILGRDRQALKLLDVIKVDAATQQDPNLQMAAGINYGHLLQTIGQWESAEKLLNALLERSQSIEAFSPYQDNILLTLGNLYAIRTDTKKDVQKAIDYYKQVEKNSADQLTITQAKLNELKVLIALNRRLAARTLAQRILPALNDLPKNSQGLAAKINWSSRLRELQQVGGVPEESKQLIELQMERVIQEARQIKATRSLIYALSILGEWYLNYPYQAAQGKAYLQEAIALVQEIKEPELAYRLHWRLGQQATRERNIPEAIAAYDDTIGSLQELRTDFALASPSQRISFQATIKPIYSEFLKLLLEPKDGVVPQSNLQQARLLLESFQIAELDNFFKDACSTVKTFDIDEVDPTAAIIYPIVLPERLDLIVALPNQPLKYYSQPVNEQQLGNVVRSLQRGLYVLPLRNGILNNDYEIWAKNLHNWLIKPILADLQASGVKTLAFVPDGVLRSVPMSVLFDGEQYLIEQFAIAVAPGLQMVESKPLAEQQLQVLSSGLTEARQGFTPLPNVSQELERIGTELPSQTFLNESFTAPAIQQAIAASDYPIVHFATHGQFSSQLEDTFILTWDGRINANDLKNLLSGTDNKTIELLVLSACQTAVGDDYAALGLAGIAVRAGARSTLASLWSVDDSATSELMQQFYQNLNKHEGNRAAALQNAQKSLIQNPETEHPFFWSSFMLVGSWL